MNAAARQRLRRPKRMLRLVAIVAPRDVRLRRIASHRVHLDAPFTKWSHI